MAVPRASVRLRPRVMVGGMAAVLLMASCAGDDAVITTTEPTVTTAPVTTTTETTTTTTTLPGEPIDLFPQQGDVLAVVGVDHDSELNVRAAPGTDQDIIGALAPLADDVVATGREQSLNGSIWYEVTVGDITGWVSSAYLAWLGSVDDITTQVTARLGDTPAAETMEELGRIVAEAQASEDPPSEISMTVAPAVGDLGEVTYDVVGLGDDSVFGVRLHVFGQPGAGGEGFTLRSVEATLLCARGAPTEGLCP